MKITPTILNRLKLLQGKKNFPMPLERMHGWRSAPDEGDHTHCAVCFTIIYRDDPVVGCYLEYVSIVFCSQCVCDNAELIRKWLAPQPKANDD